MADAIGGTEPSVDAAELDGLQRRFRSWLHELSHLVMLVTCEWPVAAVRRCSALPRASLSAMRQIGVALADIATIVYQNRSHTATRV